MILDVRTLVERILSNFRESLNRIAKPRVSEPLEPIMTKEIIDNVEIEYDYQTEQWSSRYTSLETPVASCGETREEALAMLVEAIALYAEDR